MPLLSQGHAARPRHRQPVPAERGAVRRRRGLAEEAGAARRRALGRRAMQIRSFTNEDSVVGTTWPYQFVQLKGADPPVPVKIVKPTEGTTGWSDTWMISSEAQHPNCMYLWMNHMISPKAQATVAEGFGEAPANLKACELTKDPNHCTSTTQRMSRGGRTSTTGTPHEDCGDDETRRPARRSRIGKRLDGNQGVALIHPDLDVSPPRAAAPEAWGGGSRRSSTDIHGSGFGAPRAADRMAPHRVLRLAVRPALHVLLGHGALHARHHPRASLWRTSGALWRQPVYRDVAWRTVPMAPRSPSPARFLPFRSRTTWPGWHRRGFAASSSSPCSCRSWPATS